MEDKTRTEFGPTPEIRKLSASDALFERMQEINDLIARRAYELFAARGFAHGHHFDDQPTVVNRSQGSRYLGA